METNRSIGMCVLVDENNHRCDALFLNWGLLQESSEGQLSLIRSLRDDVPKLSKKMSRFSTSLSFVNCWRLVLFTWLKNMIDFFFFRQTNKFLFIKIQMIKKITLMWSFVLIFLSPFLFRFFRITMVVICWTLVVVIQPITHENYYESYWLLMNWLHLYYRRDLMIYIWKNHCKRKDLTCWIWIVSDLFKIFQFYALELESYFDHAIDCRRDNQKHQQHSNIFVSIFSSIMLKLIFVEHFLEAIQTHCRISKSKFKIFYSKIIQKTEWFFYIMKVHETKRNNEPPNFKLYQPVSLPTITEAVVSIQRQPQLITKEN